MRCSVLWTSIKEWLKWWRIDYRIHFSGFLVKVRKISEIEKPHLLPLAAEFHGTKLIYVHLQHSIFELKRYAPPAANDRTADLF